MPTVTNLTEVRNALSDASGKARGLSVRELMLATGLGETTVRMSVNRLVTDGFAERDPEAASRFKVITTPREEVNKMATTKKKAPRKVAAKKAKATRPPRGEGKSASERDAAVLAFVKSRKNGVTLEDVRTKFGLSYNLAYLSLSRAREAGSIVKTATGTRTPIWSSK